MREERNLGDIDDSCSALAYPFKRNLFSWRWGWLYPAKNRWFVYVYLVNALSSNLHRDTNLIRRSIDRLQLDCRPERNGEKIRQILTARNGLAPRWATKNNQHGGVRSAASACKNERVYFAPPNAGWAFFLRPRGPAILEEKFANKQSWLGALIG